MRISISVFILFVLSFIFCFPCTAGAEDDFFQRYELTVEGNEIDYVIEDLNGDGVNDLLFLHMVKNNGSESRIFSVFYQTETGFPPIADQRFEVDKNAVVYCVSDIAGNPGKEILFFTKKGLFYYFNESGKFNPQPKMLMETDSMFKIPDGSFLEYYNFAADLNEDGMDEIIVPDFHHVVIHHPDAAGAYTKKSILRVDLLSRIISAKEAGKYIVASYIIPNIIIADYNGDIKKDLIFVLENSLLIYFQNSDGTFSDDASAHVELEESLTKTYALRIRDRNIQQRDRYKNKTGIKTIQDLNHDGIMDVITETYSDAKSAFTPTKTLKIYFGRMAGEDPSKGPVFNSKPDNTIVTTGFPGRGAILDVNNDHKMDLLIPSIELGFFKIIRILLSGKAEVDLHVYKATNKGDYNPEPDQVIGFTLHIDRKGRKLPVGKFEGDFNGDGKTDYMGDAEEAIVIVFNPNSEVLKSDPDVVFPVKIPQNGIKVKPGFISDDPYSDIVMIYSEAIDKTEKNKNVCVLLNRNGGKKIK
ncbi:MAG: hypothetical protein R6X10_02340 [Desulfobacterales bacterium]